MFVRHLTHLFALVAFALAAGGCASYAWEKPGVAEDVAQRDWNECSLQARRIAADLDWLLWRNWGWPGDPWHASFTHGGGPFGWGPDPSVRWDMERNAFSRCMEVKGYALVKQPRS